MVGAVISGGIAQTYQDVAEIAMHATVVSLALFSGVGAGVLSSGGLSWQNVAEIVVVHACRQS